MKSLNGLRSGCERMALNIRMWNCVRWVQAFVMSALDDE